MVAVCGVCGQEHSGGMNRMGGMDVCDVCALGGVSTAVGARGWTLSSRSFTRRMSEDHVYYCVEVEGSIAQDPRLEATFRMKAGLWSFLGLFAGIKVSDPMFNRLVLATSATRDRTAAFLQDDGIQSAVMDLVGERGRVDVSGRRVRCLVQQENSSPDQARVEAEVAVLMAHLESFARAK